MKKYNINETNISGKNKVTVFMHYKNICNQTLLTLNSLKKQSTNLKIILLMNGKEKHLPILPIKSVRIVKKQVKLPLQDEYLGSINKLLKKNCPLKFRPNELVEVFPTIDELIHIQYIASKENITDFFVIQSGTVVHQSLFELSTIMKQCDALIAGIPIDERNTSFSFSYFRDTASIKHLTDYISLRFQISHNCSSVYLDGNTTNIELLLLGDYFNTFKYSRNLISLPTVSGNLPIETELYEHKETCIEYLSTYIFHALAAQQTNIGINNQLNKRIIFPSPTDSVFYSNIVWKADVLTNEVPKNISDLVPFFYQRKIASFSTSCMFPIIQKSFTFQ